MADQQPIPFEIVRIEGEPLTVASNGTTRLTCTEPDARVFRRRAITGVMRRPPGEVLIPQLNALCGELLATPDITPEAAVQRLLAIAGLVPTEGQRRIEWVVCEVAGVRVYVDGLNVIVSRQDITP